MAHFAQLDDKNKVINIIVVNDKDVLDENGVEKEEVGVSFLKSLFGENTNWVQTSYNGNIKNKYASIGDTYDKISDVFISPPGEIDTSIIDVEEVTPIQAIEAPTE